MALDAEEVIEHYGILGMKWGVRRSDEELDRVGRTRKGAKAAKKLDKQDEKYVRRGVKRSEYRKARNEAITNLNRSLPALAQKPKYQKHIASGRTLGDGSSTAKDYVKEVNDTVTAEFNRVSQKHFKESKSGRLRARMVLGPDPNFPDVLIEDNPSYGGPPYRPEVEHADEDVQEDISLLIKLEYVRDPEGRVTSVKVVDETELDHSDLADDIIAHYGVLGMKWGVRRDRERERERSAKSRAKSMSDDDLKKTVSRMNLEKQYRNLHRDANMTRGQQYLQQLEKQTANVVVTAIVGTGTTVIANKLWPIAVDAVKKRFAGG